MFVVDFISKDVPTLSPQDKIGEAIELMDNIRLNQLPMVKDKEYLGLMDYRQLTEEQEEGMLKDLSLPLFKPAVQKEVHFMEALQIMGEYKLEVLPVIDELTHYYGVVYSETLLGHLTRFNSFGKEGGWIMLEMNLSDFMLSEIAQVAESEDISILGVHTLTDPALRKMNVLLKTNRGSLDSFVVSLQQRKYEVIYQFSDFDDEDNLQKNYNHLMNYLSMG